MPVEAMACGTPVIANAVGGASESVNACLGGSLLTSFDQDETVAAFALSQTIDRRLLPSRTRQFSNESFADGIRGWVDSSINVGQTADGGRMRQ